MRLQVVKKSFNDKAKNEVIGYNALVVAGEIDDIKFECALTPADDSKTVKKALINNILNGAHYEVSVSKIVKDGNVYKRIITQVDGLGEIPLKVTQSDTDKFAIELFDNMDR